MHDFARLLHTFKASKIILQAYKLRTVELTGKMVLIEQLGLNSEWS